MIYSIYRIVTRTCHTYVGQTTNVKSRFRHHNYDVNHGLLGSVNIPKSKNPIIEILATCQDPQTALLLESRYIALEILANPTKCCNINLGKSNKFNDDTRE